jgi:hypothetical protein
MQGLICLLALLCSLGAGVYINWRYPSKANRLEENQHPDLWYD